MFLLMTLINLECYHIGRTEIVFFEYSAI